MRSGRDMQSHWLTGSGPPPRWVRIVAVVLILVIASGLRADHDFNDILSTVLITGLFALTAFAPSWLYDGRLASKTRAQSAPGVAVIFTFFGLLSYSLLADYLSHGVSALIAVALAASIAIAAAVGERARERRATVD